MVKACRQLGRFPTNSELLLLRSSDPDIPNPSVVKRHFGGRDDLIAVISKLAAENPNYADIVPLLPAVRLAPPTRVGPKATGGHVYLLKSGDFYKIGRSEELERRVKEITVALPDKVTLIHSILTDDPPGIEGYWHRRFADRRANGEWFKLTASDVAAFRKRKFQ